MTKIGQEYSGKLPPGVAEQNRKALASYRRAARAGVRVRVVILSPGDCPISDGQKGVIYSIEDIPSLPLPGCNRSPCCACCYSPVVK